MPKRNIGHTHCDASHHFFIHSVYLAIKGSSPPPHSDISASLRVLILLHYRGFPRHGKRIRQLCSQIIHFPDVLNFDCLCHLPFSKVRLLEVADRVCDLEKPNLAVRKMACDCVAYSCSPQLSQIHQDIFTSQVTNRPP